MRRQLITLAVGVVVMMLIGYLPVTKLAAQDANTKSSQAAVLCRDGTWSPAPVSQLQSGTPADPEFHTVWGYACGGVIYMVRFGNQVKHGPSNNNIDVSILGRTALQCKGGTWSPTPVSQLQSGTAVPPQFHTVWGYACGGQIYMVRFSNQIKNGSNNSNIDVSILGKTTLQ